MSDDLSHLPTPRSDKASFWATWPISLFRDESGIVVDLEVVQQLERELAAARAALEDIRTSAHCLAKAGPLLTPTHDDAWGQFMKLEVKAVAGLAASRKRSTT